MSLADFNYHVIPGDVLLLSGKGKHGVLNRGAQALVRGTRATFTHVAIAVDNAMIAEAMPPGGVRIQAWADVENGYFLDRCLVARHSELAARTLTRPADVLARVQYYIDQAYRLTALARREAVDQAGLVCSQFVALVLEDLGVPLASRAAMNVLPMDIAADTQRNGWRQFSLLEYGLCAWTPQPAPGRSYGIALQEHVGLDGGLELGPADRARAEALAQDLAESTTQGDMSRVNAFLKESDAHLARGASLQREVNETVRKNISDMQVAARTLVEFDRLSIAVQELAARNPSNPALQAELNGLLAKEQIDPGEELSGAHMLQRWRGLYIDRHNAPPQFMVEADAPERLRRHREIFGRQVESILATAKRLNATAEAVIAEISATLQERPIVPDLAAKVWKFQASATVLKSAAPWLSHDSSDETLARADTYEAIALTDLANWRAQSDDDRQLAGRQVQLLLDLDVERLSWVSSMAQIKAIENLIANVLGGAEPRNV